MSAPVLLYNAAGDAILVRRPSGFAREVEVERWQSDVVLHAVPGTVLSPFDPWAGWDWSSRRAPK